MRLSVMHAAHRHRLRHRLALGLGLASALAAAAADAPRCERISTPTQTPLVELYTSEGCDSCPPADRWLSSLKRRTDVLAAAFHVDYWDRLGWKDRFARAEHTARQTEAQARSGARFIYTPQVLVNGRDWRGWPELPAGRSAARVRITLQREAQRITVHVTAAGGAPVRLGMWWAWLEDDHVSQVRAGENAGVTLRHDHVVRASGRVPDWRVRDGSDAALDLPPAPSGDRKARLLVVVTDGTSGLPLQALQLDC